MKRWAWLSLLCVAGCGPSGEESLLRDIKKINEDAAAKIENATDLEDVKDAMNLRAKRQKELAARMQKLTREQKESLSRKVEGGENLGEAGLEEALAAFQTKLKEGPNPMVVVETSMGDMKVELYEKLAPLTVGNFLAYVDDKHYDGLIFHRVISNFMIQGGGFAPGALVRNAKEKSTRAPVPNEAFNGLANKRGTIAMARTNDPHSATAQFYINVKDNAMLDRVNAQDGYGYTVFGKVVEGMDVADKIRAVKTTRVGGHDDVPVQDVIIKSVRRAEK